VKYQITKNIDAEKASRVKIMTHGLMFWMKRSIFFGSVKSMIKPWPVKGFEIRVAFSRNKRSLNEVFTLLSEHKVNAFSATLLVHYSPPYRVVPTPRINLILPL